MNDELPRTDPYRLVGGRKALLAFGGVLILAFLALFFAAWQKTKTPIGTGDYEGTIVDRWADYRESDQGAQPRLRLVIESQDGQRFTVKVDPNTYESARVGMRIKSRSGQIALIDSERNSTSGK